MKPGRELTFRVRCEGEASPPLLLNTTAKAPAEKGKQPAKNGKAAVKKKNGVHSGLANDKGSHDDNGHAEKLVPLAIPTAPAEASEPAAEVEQPEAGLEPQPAAALKAAATSRQPEAVLAGGSSLAAEAEGGSTPAAQPELTDSSGPQAADASAAESGAEVVPEKADPEPGKQQEPSSDAGPVAVPAETAASVPAGEPASEVAGPAMGPRASEAATDLEPSAPPTPLISAPPTEATAAATFEGSASTSIVEASSASSPPPPAVCEAAAPKAAGEVAPAQLDALEQAVKPAEPSRPTWADLLKSKELPEAAVPKGRVTAVRRRLEPVAIVNGGVRLSDPARLQMVLRLARAVRACQRAAAAEAVHVCVSFDRGGGGGGGGGLISSDPPQPSF